MKQIIFIIFALCPIVFLHAQNKDDFEQWKKQQEKEFNDYSQQQEKEFNDFRDQANAEFTEYMRQAWEEFAAFKGIPAPKLPEPVAPPVIDPKKQPTSYIDAGIAAMRWSNLSRHRPKWLR